MAAQTKSSRVWPVVRWSAIAVGFIVVVIGLMLWLSGALHRKIPASPSVVQGRPIGDAEVVAVRRVSVPAIESAVGSIRAVQEVSVASKLLARVDEVNVLAGQRVSGGEVLVRLGDQDLTARLQQAEAAVRLAQATRNQAKIELTRVDQLFQEQSAPPIELDRATTALASAEAQLDGAVQSRNEAQTILGYATISSPIGGMVVDKQVEVGDTVTPGQVLLTLYDPKRMQLIAAVRESLAQRLQVGNDIDVRVDALGKTCSGRISEIVPEAETSSRSFLVKVTGPCPPGIYSGMFGRLLIPLDSKDTVVIPHRAVRRVGQLNVVDVVVDDGLRRRIVQLGEMMGDDVEVLSGLSEGEQVALAVGAD